VQNRCPTGPYGRPFNASGSTWMNFRRSRRFRTGSPCRQLRVNSSTVYGSAGVASATDGFEVSISEQMKVFRLSIENMNASRPEFRSKATT
jgi:hypothetical protein